jgi:hypothetical protein
VQRGLSPQPPIRKWCAISPNGCSLHPKSGSPTPYCENLRLVGDASCAWCGMAQKDKDNIRYTPLPYARTPEMALDALVAVYAFILECHESSKAAGRVGGPHEVKEDDVDPTESLP